MSFDPKAEAARLVLEDGCADACYAMPDCARCGLRKAPRGRDVGAAAGNSYCGWDCPGYNEEPRSGHLWPSERPAAVEAALRQAYAAGLERATEEAEAAASGSAGPTEVRTAMSIARRIRTLATEARKGGGHE